MLHTSQPLIKPENTFVLDRKLISIHSVDRDHQKWPNSNQFGIDLGVAFSNVQSMRLVNFAVPTNNYTFSTAYQNTKMSFTYTVYYPLKFVGFGTGATSWNMMKSTLEALFGSSFSAPSDVTFEYWSDSSIGGSDEWTEMPWTGTNSVSTIGSWPSGTVKPDYFTGYGRIKWSPSEFSITIPEGSYSPTNLTETIESLMNKAVFNSSAQPGYYFLPGPPHGNISDPSNVIVDPTTVSSQNHSEWYSSLDTGIKPFVVHYNKVRNRILFGAKTGSFSLLFGKQEIYDPTCDVNKAIFHQYTKWGLPSYLGFDKKTYTGDTVDINNDPFQESIGGLYLPFESNSPWLTGDNRILDLCGNGGVVPPWSNIPTTTDNHGLRSFDYRSTYAAIREAFRATQQFSIQTKTTTYTNMYLRDIPHEEDPTRFDTVTMILEFIEAQFFNVQVQALAESDVVNNSDSSTVNRGEQSNQDGGSVASNLFDRFNRRN